MATLRRSFHHLVNADLHPEVLPFAFKIAHHHLAGVTMSGETVSDDIRRLRAADATAGLEGAVAALPSVAVRSRFWWHRDETPVAPRRVVHALAQYAPTALVDGCWLQRSADVGSGHTAVGSRLTAAFVRQIDALDHEPEQRFVHHFATACQHCLGPFESVGSRSFSDRPEILEASFSLPVFLLSIGQFPRAFLPEIVGLNLAWHLLAQPEFAWHLLADTCAAHPTAGLRVPQRRNASTREPVEIARLMLSQASDPRETWQRMWGGIASIVDARARWSSATADAAPGESEDPRAAMIAILERKAPHAAGYHRQRRLGGVRLDERFQEDDFDPETFLNDLAASPYVMAGDPEGSSLVREITSFGGSMCSVFAADEVAAVKAWIASLDDSSGAGSNPPRARPAVPDDGDDLLEGMASASEFRARSETGFRRSSTRRLYHCLVNVEMYPEVLPVALRRARERLAGVRADLMTADRPIPSEHFSPDALWGWVEAKHRQQVDSYVSAAERPRLSRRALIESTLQLAPLILIDGSWLQGFAGPLVHRPVGSLLFRIFYEEVGQGDPERHHANIYRALLAEMGEEVPPVHAREFAEWQRFRDASFEIPVLWMCLSRFPRHFLPEILGLNLAVELAGVGGPYLEAHDALKYFGYPTLFVDVHNAADNICEGHAALATRAIVTYLEEVAASHGPDVVDQHWQRVWSGVRSTLPKARTSWRSRLTGRRWFRRDSGTPLIFPS